MTFLSKTATPRNPMVTAYLFLVFATPFSSGSPWHIVYFLCWFSLFIIYSFLHTKKYQFSLIDQLKQYHPVAFYLLLSFAISSFVSYILIMFGDVSIEHKVFSSVRYAIYFLVFCYVFSLARFCLVNNISHAQIFWGYMLGTLVLISLLLMIYHFGGAPNAAKWAVNPPIGEHARLMGMIASVSVIIAVVFFLLKADNPYRLQIFLWLSILVLNAFLIWTGSRASMLLVLLAVVLVIILGKINLKISAFKIISLCLCLCLSVLVSDQFSIYEWNGLHRALSASMISDSDMNAVSDIDTVSDEGLSDDAKDNFTSGRMTMWRITINAVKQAPWFGLGPYGYFFIPDRPNIYDHPHNFFLQFLVEWGLVGAAFLLGLLLYFAWFGLKNICQAFQCRDMDYIISGCVIFILTFNGLVDGAYFLGQPLFALATAFAVFPFFSKAERNYFMTNIINK